MIAWSSKIAANILSAKSDIISSSAFSGSLPNNLFRFSIIGCQILPSVLSGIFVKRAFRPSKRIGVHLAISSFFIVGTSRRPFIFPRSSTANWISAAVAIGSVSVTSFLQAISNRGPVSNSPSRFIASSVIWSARFSAGSSESLFFGSSYFIFIALIDA